MADIEPLFPNMPVVRQQDPLSITAPRRDTVDDWMEQTLLQERRGRTTAWIIACILIVVCFKDTRLGGRWWCAFRWRWLFKINWHFHRRLKCNLRC